MAYKPIGALAMLQRNLLIYGLGGVIIPFIGIKIIDLLITALRWHEVTRNIKRMKIYENLFSEIRGAVMATLVLAVVCCGIYPLVVFGIGQVLFRDKANGSLIVDKARNGARLASARPAIYRRKIFSLAALRSRQWLRRVQLERQQPGADFAKAARQHRAERRRTTARKTGWPPMRRCRPMRSPRRAAALIRISACKMPSSRPRVSPRLAGFRSKKCYR